MAAMTEQEHDEAYTALFGAWMDKLHFTAGIGISDRQFMPAATPEIRQAKRRIDARIRYRKAHGMPINGPAWAHGLKRKNSV